MVVAAYQKGENQLKMDKFLNKDATITNRWMELIIDNNLPVTYVEKKGFNKFITIQDTISYKTFLKRMKLVMEYIEELMRKRLASVKRFGLMIDGWSSNYTHYLAVFIVTKEYGTELLSFSPLNDETSLTAASMADSIDWIIDYYKLDNSKCIFLVGDNTEVNPALARKLGLYFIGCHSHTLNLAIQNKVLQSGQLKSLLKKVHKMMKKLSTTKRRALLKTKTQLRPKFLNATRWSSCFNMMKRFFEIIGPVTELFTEDREDDRVSEDAPADHYSRAKMYSLIPNADERLMLQEYYDMLHPFESITSSLQGKKVNLYEARLFFDVCMRRSQALNFPATREAMKEYLGEGVVASKSKNSHDFVNGIIKILKDGEGCLTNDEIGAVEVFKKPEIIIVATDYSGLSPEEEVAARLAPRNISNYDDVSWIPSTTCEVERFFSQCKLNHSERRLALTNDHLEMIMFLKFHKQKWTVEIIDEALKAGKDVDSL